MRHLPYHILICLLLAGCAGGDLLVQRQGAMEARLGQIMQAQNSSTIQLGEISVQLKELREQVSRQAAVEKEQGANIDALQEKVRLLTWRVEKSAADAVAPQPAKIELVNRDSGAESREEAVQSAYMSAFGLFSANNYKAATDAFVAFIATYPESEYAANARFWLGECYFAEGRFREAVEAYSRVLEMKPAEKRGADAMLKTGLSWYGLNEADKGRAALRMLIEKYPRSEAAVKAGEKLDQK